VRSGWRIAATLDKLREALVALYGTDFGLHSVTWLSRFTDAARHDFHRLMEKGSSGGVNNECSNYHPLGLIGSRCFLFFGGSWRIAMLCHAVHITVRIGDLGSFSRAENGICGG
jgi:hypothetical protein